MTMSDNVKYDPTVHGHSKLGAFSFTDPQPLTIVVPGNPTKAQISKSISFIGPRLHIGIGDAYLTGAVGRSLACPVTVLKAWMDTMVTAGTTEPSYSQTGSAYLPLQVKQNDPDSHRFFLQFDYNGTTYTLARIIVDANVPVQSTDEPPQAVSEAGDGTDEQ
jgi:hypothetical protein